MCPAPPLFQLMFVYPRSASVTQDSGEWVTEQASHPTCLVTVQSMIPTSLFLSDHWTSVTGIKDSKHLV